MGTADITVSQSQNKQIFNKEAQKHLSNLTTTFITYICILNKKNSNFSILKL